MAKGSTKAVMGKASALKAAAASKQAASNASKAKAAAAASNATAKAAKSSVPAYAQNYVKKKAEMNATKPSLRPGAGNLLGIPGRAAGVKRVPSPGAGGRLAGAMQGLGNAVKRTAVNSMQRAGASPTQRTGASPMQGLGAAAAGAPRPGMKKGGTAKKRYT